MFLYRKHSIKLSIRLYPFICINFDVNNSRINLEPFFHQEASLQYS